MGTGRREKAMNAESTTNEMTENKKYKAWLIKSILVTVLCNRILGLIGVIYAVKARYSYKIGEMDKFVRFSLKSRTWTLLGFMLAMLVMLVTCVSSLAYSLTTATYIIGDTGNPVRGAWFLLLLSFLVYIIFFIIKVLKIGRLLENGQGNQATDERQRTKMVSLWWFVGTIVAYLCFHWGFCS
jgi:uncharacterized membrane protein